MHLSDRIFTEHDSETSRASGPLPKSDSVQSLVSLINCPSNPSSVAGLDDPSVRGVDVTGKTHAVAITSETDLISLSGLNLKTIALSALDSTSVSPPVREISLAANALELVDLSPLASCQLLTVLSLNSNGISSIDLFPLASCVRLERLWLHDNRLECIDLSPLKSCKSLRSLYLEDNSLHDSTLDLTALGSTPKLRSLRLGGNRLGGKLDLTPLLQCPVLSVFNIDSSVSLTSDGESSQARVSPALRRIVRDVIFSGRVISHNERPVKRRTTPPVSPKSGESAARHRRRVAPPSAVSLQSASPAAEKTTTEQPLIVKVLLVGFRRLARYAAEDAFSRCGKVMIRAANQDVSSCDPVVLLDSHLVILYAPAEKTLRQVTVAVGRIPTVIIGTERYRSTADTKILELLDRFNFYADPLDQEDTRVVYNMGKDYATVTKQQAPGSVITDIDRSLPSGQLVASPPRDVDDHTPTSCSKTFRKSPSEPSLASKYGSVSIELEDIEDDGEEAVRNSSEGKAGNLSIPRSRSVDQILDEDPLGSDLTQLPATTWAELARKLMVRGRKTRGDGGSYGNEMSMHGKNKLRAERAAIEVAFSDLGGYAGLDSCTGIARSCGLPKCAGPLLFRAVYGSSYEIESTTPEAGVPNPPMKRKNRRISSHAFLAYWDSRMKSFDGEERLSNILEDSFFSRPPNLGNIAGHSRYGAPCPRASQGTSHLSLTLLKGCSGLDDPNISPDRGSSLTRPRSTSCMPSDLSCPCDAGVESLITAFMEGRSSRFGSFALVKITEAVAIGSALVMYGLRGISKNRVGGQARPVCPKEARGGKLNAALIAAEVGIFEGVASGLSMDQIRSVKGCYATEASPTAVAKSSGLALNYTLTVEEVQRFCISRKTLLPGAVEKTMATHCRSAKEMTLAEFAVFLSVLNNICSNGAVDYFFSVVDIDQDERWTLPDLRHFHMEKEKMWLSDGMAVSDLVDFWVNLIDMIRPANPSMGISRREFLKLGVKERKLVIQSLLFVDDDHSLLNIRRTMELNRNSASLGEM